MSAIEVADLVVRYQDLTAVDGISFSAEPGEVVALLGPNGAGKTSTVETIEGYRRPTGGSTRVLGLDPVSQHGALMPKIGVMLQGGGLYPTMPPMDALNLFAAYYDNPRAPAELLDLVGLTTVAKTPSKRLSGGERQRLSLALALVGRPSVVFLDEPTAGVDPAGRIEVRSVITGLRDDGACVLLTTHELPEAERLADRVLIIDRGRIVADGSPDSLTAAPHTILFSSPAEIPLDDLGARLGAAVRALGGDDYEASLIPTPANIAALTALLAELDIAVDSVRAGRHSLEDVFLRLTGVSLGGGQERSGQQGGGREEQIQ